MDDLHLPQNIPVEIEGALLVMTDPVGPSDGQERPGATLLVATDDEEHAVIVAEGDTITLRGRRWRVEQVTVVSFSGDVDDIGTTLNPQSSLTLRRLDS